MNSANSTYGKRTNGADHGVVFTREEVVCAMLDLADYRQENDLRHVRLLEPAAGDGAFACEILKRLIHSSGIHNFDIQQALAGIRFVEMEPTMAKKLRVIVEQTLAKILDKEASRRWAEEMVIQSDFLSLKNMGVFDIITGNPPYVRHEQIPAEQKESYKRQFHTFRHRADLYIPFFEHALKMLSPNGALCFICSNRWLKNQYGATLRSFIARNFHLQILIDLQKTNPFQEEVIAYPSITLIRGSRQEAPVEVHELSSLAGLGEIVSRTLPPKHLAEQPRTKDWSPLFVNAHHGQYGLEAIEAQGFKIGIGVATGSDRVFIGRALAKEVEAELLLPLVTAKCLRNDQFDWNGHYIVNPFQHNGKLIDLNRFPMAKVFFAKHEETLRKRHVAQKNPSQWYRTIDRINPTLTSQPKILLPDISGNQYIFIDKGQFYPHHNLYYITGRDLTDLQFLAAILMSDFVRNQLLQLSNQMNGGFPRWQSQNLRKLRIPVLDGASPSLKGRFIGAYENRDIAAINCLMEELVEQAGGYAKGKGKGQLELGL